MKLILSLVLLLSLGGCALMKEGMGRCEVIQVKYYDSGGQHLFSRDIKACQDAK